MIFSIKSHFISLHIKGAPGDRHTERRLLCYGDFVSCLWVFLLWAWYCHPGTPAAAATVFDGYPMAQKGLAGKAIGMATVASGRRYAYAVGHARRDNSLLHFCVGYQ